MFEGMKPKWWTRRCKRFSQFYRIPEEQKINVDAAYLNDTVDSWYQGWIQDEGNQGSWVKFAKGLCKRFGERSMADAIEEFSKLKQEGLVEYQAKFEDLRSIVYIVQPRLTKQYLVSSFIRGLNEELRLMMKMMMQTSVRQAAEKARLQELTLEAIYNKYTIATEIQPLFYQPLEGDQVNVHSKDFPNPIAAKSSTMEQQRKLGLCYRSGAKFSPGHRCQKQLLNMEGTEEENEEEELARIG